MLRPQQLEWVGYQCAGAHIRERPRRPHQPPAILCPFRQKFPGSATGRRFLSATTESCGRFNRPTINRLSGQRCRVHIAQQVPPPFGRPQCVPPRARIGVRVRPSGCVQIAEAGDLVIHRRHLVPEVEVFVAVAGVVEQSVVLCQNWVKCTTQP